MAALVSSNGIVTIINTTDTFTAPGYGSSLGNSTGAIMQPQAVSLYGSAVSQLVLVDADGVVLLEAGVGTAKTHAIWDSHFFAGQRPWKTPIHCTTLTAGARLRIYI